ncbi:MAG: hypothetical protein GY853_05950 [PVC group bacterium]|nr:hypothetical protein [PVC group bacterium]
MKKIVLLFLLFSVVVTSSIMASEKLSEANNTFTYKNKPIHPFLIREFSNWCSDYCPPITKSVDVSASFGTNQYQSDEIQTRNGWLFAEETEEKEVYTAYEAFYYRWLGVMGDDIHVVETGANGGGTGLYMDLMFLRFSEDEMFWEDKKEKQLILTILGTYSLGDRYGGNIEVYTDKVIIPGSTRQLGGGAIEDVVVIELSELK